MEKNSTQQATSKGGSQEERSSYKSLIVLGTMI